MTPQYCIIWDDPIELEAPVKITIPSPEWLGERMASGLSEQEAMEQLVVKDLPPRVWANTAGSNRQLFRIMPLNLLPTDRTSRNAWRLAA